MKNSQLRPSGRARERRRAQRLDRNRLALRNRDRQALADELRRQRGNPRGKLHLAGQIAVDETDQSARREADQQARNQPQIPSRARDGGHDAGQTAVHADRQIHLAGNRRKALAERRRADEDRAHEDA